MRIAFSGFSIVLAAALAGANGTAEAQDSELPVFELRLTDAPAKDPKDGYYATALAFGKVKERTVLYFSVRHGGLSRWDHPKNWSGDATRSENKATKMSSIDGANVRSIVASVDGQIILVSYDTVPATTGAAIDANVRAFAPFLEVWDAETGKAALILKSNKERSIMYGTLSSDGKTVAIAEYFGGEPLGDSGVLRRGAEPRISFRDVAAGKPIRSLTGLYGPLALSSDGKTMVAVKGRLKETRCVLVDAASGELRCSLTQPKRMDQDGKDIDWSPEEFRFSPDGKVVAGRGAGKTGWVVWDTRQGKIVRGEEITIHQPAITAVWFSPPQGTITTRTNGVRAVALSPDGKLLATSEDGVIRVRPCSR